MRYCNKEEMKQILDQNPKYKVDLFKRGFLITNDGSINLSEYPFYDNWSKQELGDYFVYIHNKQKLYTYEEQGKLFFLIGHAYNPFTLEIDEINILKNISQKSINGEKDYFELISELTGVFLCGFIENKKIQMVGDCVGIQATYYGIVKNNIYISSHMNLIGDICDLQRDEYIDELVNYKHYKLYGPCLPGDLSIFKEIKRLVPNTYVTYENNECKVTRFFPKYELKICGNDEEYNDVVKQIASIFKNTLISISKKWDNPAISMTGGTDSKLTLAAANGIYDKFKYFSYISQYSESIDAEAAHKICENLNQEHKIYEISDKDEDFEDIEIIRKIITYNVGNVGKLNDNDIRKRAYFRDTEDFDVEVKSWASEIVRATYYKKYHKDKLPKHLSPRNITSMYKIILNNRKLAKQTDKVFEEYIEKVDFGKNFSNYDESDMVYWEIRYGGWGGLILTGEQRYSFDITLPFNNRYLMKLFLSAPLEYRIQDKVHRDVTDLLNKDLYDMGIHVVNYNKTNKRAFFEKMYFNLNNWFQFI